MITSRQLLRSLFLSLPLLLLAASVVHADEVVFLIDKSFSMGALDQRSRPRYERALERATGDIRFHLAVRDTVTVIFFDSNLGTPIRIETEEDAQRAFLSYTPGGDTNIIDALLFAFRELQQAAHPLIYLYTDGEQTERGAVSWEEIVSLYNDYNGGASPDRRIKLFHIRWRDGDKETATDAALRRIETITELAARGRTWASVEKLYIRPADLKIEVDLDERAVEEPVAVTWFTIDASEGLDRRGVKFRVTAEVLSDEPVDLIVTPSLIDCDRDLDIDSSILLSFRCNGVENLAPQQEYPIRVTFTPQTEVDLTTVRISPPGGVVQGALRVRNNPSFTLLEPKAGILRLESREVGATEQVPVKLAWNPAAEGRTVRIDYRFPIAVQADLLEMTTEGWQPLEPAGAIVLDDTGCLDLLLSVRRSVHGEFEGEVLFDGFGCEQVLHVDYGMPVASVAASPGTFTTTLTRAAGQDAGSLIAAPITVSFMATPEIVDLGAQVELRAEVQGSDAARVTVDPSVFALTADSLTGQRVELTFGFDADTAPLAGETVSLSLSFGLTANETIGDRIELEPDGGRLTARVEVIEAPSFLCHLTRGDTSIKAAALSLGGTHAETLRLSWNGAATGSDVTIDVVSTPTASVELFEARGDARIPIRSGGIHLGPEGGMDLEVVVTGLQPGTLDSAVTLRAFGGEQVVLVEGDVEVGHVDLFVDRSVHSLRCVVGEWSTTQGTIVIAPGNAASCGLSLDIDIESDEGVRLELTDDDGKPVKGPLVLPAKPGITTRLWLRGRNDWVQLSRPGDRPRNFVKITPTDGSSVTFGDDRTTTVKIPVGFALLPPEISLRKDGSNLDRVAVGFLVGDGMDGGYSVSVDVALDRIGAGLESKADAEILQIEASGSELDAFFLATGGSSTTLGELRRDPRIGFRFPTPGFRLGLEEPIGSVSLSGASGVLSIEPRTIDVAYTRKALLMVFGGGGLLLLVLGGGLLAASRKKRLSGWFVIENCPGEAAGTTLDLSVLRAASCRIGLDNSGCPVAGGRMESPVLTLRVTKTGVVVSAIGSTEALLDDMPLVQESTLFDLSVIEIGDVRLRYRSDVEAEEELVGDAPVAPAEGEDAWSSGLGLSEDDREELVLEDDDDEVCLTEEEVEDRHRSAETAGSEVGDLVITESTEARLSETIVLEDDD